MNSVEKTYPFVWIILAENAGCHLFNSFAPPELSSSIQHVQAIWIIVFNVGIQINSLSSLIEFDLDTFLSNFIYSRM